MLDLQVHPNTLVSTAYPTRDVRLSLEKSFPSEGKSDGPSQENLQSQKNLGVEHLRQMHSEPRRWNHPLRPIDRNESRKSSASQQGDRFMRASECLRKPDNKKAADFSTAVFTWSGQRDSNPRPSPWQGDALPAEPCPHVKFSTLEATPGFEPGVKALQASALPLGHVAILASCLIKSWLGNQPAHLRQWSGQRDSNPRPSPWQGDALPAEPCPHHKWWALQDLNL